MRLGVAHNVGLFRVRRYNYLNPFTATLAPPSLRKRLTKAPNLKSLWLFRLFALARERIYIKMHSTEIRFVTGPSNNSILYCLKVRMHMYVDKRVELAQRGIAL